MFKPPKGQREAARDVFTGSVALLANALAFAVALLLTGPAYNATNPFISGYLASQYGAVMGDLGSILWGLIVAVTVFAFARASLATAITLGGLAIAARLF
ncbi:MAG: hypothetical protein AAFX09_08200 [Pseudomonadota bacterium]